MVEAESPLPENKAALMDLIRRDWDALSAAVDALDEAQLLRHEPGQWSVKDILVHLASWERFLILTQFLGMPAAEALCVDQAVIDRADEDEINAILFERNRDRTLPDVQSYGRENHIWLMSELAKIGEDELRKPTRSVGPDLKPLVLWIIYNTYDHYAEHRRTIEAQKSG
jgi:hypothetical protein